MSSTPAILPIMYHLYSHGEANGIDLTDWGDASDKIIIKELFYSGESDLDRQRFVAHMAEFAMDCEAGVVMGVVCSPPTESFIKDIYRGLDKPIGMVVVVYNLRTLARSKLRPA